MNYEITLLKKSGKKVFKTFSCLTFAEAASHAYFLKNKFGYDFEITSVKKVED